MIPPEAATWCQDFLHKSGIPAETLEVPRLDGPGNRDIFAETCKRIPARYTRALATDPAVRAWLAEVVRQAAAGQRLALTVARGPSLLLLGPTGTGKTWQSFGAVRGLAALGVRANWRAISAADLCAMLRPRHGIDSETVFREYAGAQLLVVDDLGAMKPSEWTEEVYFRLVNHRYERLLPTLFTSNLLPSPLAEVLGGRVSSRLTEMTGRASLTGEDRRYLP